MDRILEQTDVYFQPIPGSNVTFGCTDGEGHENSDSLIYVNFRRAVQADGVPMSAFDLPIGEDVVYLSIALTPEMCAQIVKNFFWPIAHERGLWQKMLKRLLKKRWAVMTSSFAKPGLHDPGLAYKTLPPYDSMPV